MAGEKLLLVRVFFCLVLKILRVEGTLLRVEVSKICIYFSMCICAYLSLLHWSPFKFSFFYKVKP